MAQPNIWQESGIRPTRALRGEREAAPMSQRLWNLDWRAALPWHFDDGRAEFATPEAALPFVQEHYPAIFGQKDLEGRFLPSPTTEAKRRFFLEMDYFVFRVGDDVAGVLMGHPTDWTTYYIRSAALLPEYRERRVLTQFLDRLDQPLRAAGRGARRGRVLARQRARGSPADRARVRGDRVDEHRAVGADAPLHQVPERRGRRGVHAPVHGDAIFQATSTQPHPHRQEQAMKKFAAFTV